MRKDRHDGRESLLQPPVRICDERLERLARFLLAFHLLYFLPSFSLIFFFMLLLFLSDRPFGSGKLNLPSAPTSNLARLVPITPSKHEVPAEHDERRW